MPDLGYDLTVADTSAGGQIPLTNVDRAPGSPVLTNGQTEQTFKNGVSFVSGVGYGSWRVGQAGVDATAPTR